MPLFMDLHIVPGASAKDVAQAHSIDVYMEKDHNCKCLTYWVDETRGQIFCLIDAPSSEHVAELHGRSHGMVPHKIIEVQSDFVHSFLGRITDPENAALTTDGLKLIDDSAYRIIVMVQTHDPILLQHQMGAEDAKQLLQQQHQKIRDHIDQFDGREAVHKGDGILASFVTADKALAYALALQDVQQNRISMHAGEPVANSGDLFGDTLKLLQRLGYLQHHQPICISAEVKELVAKDMLHKGAAQLRILSRKEEELLISLFDALDANYADSNFQVDHYAQTLAMSQSQLYRKVTALTGHSPNDLLKLYRLEKSKELLKAGNRNVSEVAFECGFTSPSYFTKCFKNQFGLLPLAYLNLA